MFTLYALGLLLVCAFGFAVGALSLLPMKPRRP
jgi:predicted outer membrane lipoprotein